jgi:DNA-binding Lrp family transcriptional regulator
MQQKGIGERIAEMTFKEGDYHPETVKRIKNFYVKLPQEIQDKAIVTGMLNLIFEVFNDDEKTLRYIMNYLLEKERELKSYEWKYYVRYK